MNPELTKRWSNRGPALGATPTTHDAVNARLRIHDFVPFSYANGPGCRAVLWVQGCSLGCPGCFNPATHAFDQGRWIEVEELLAVLHALLGRIEGITISGGEPLQQHPALTELLRRVRATTTLSVIVLTGFTWPEVQRMVSLRHDTVQERTSERVGGLEGTAVTGNKTGPASPLTLLSYIDVLIAGRFIQVQRLAQGLRGSANKTVHLLTDRYSLQDIADVPCAEVIIAADGQVVSTGVETLCIHS